MMRTDMIRREKKKGETLQNRDMIRREKMQGETLQNRNK